MSDVRLKILIEEDNLRTAFPLPDFSQVDHEYWERLSPLNETDFRYDLAESKFWKAATKSNVSISLALRGPTWANFPSVEFQEHAIDFEAGDRIITHQWSGKESEIFDVSSIAFDSENSVLSLRVPARQSPVGNFFADVVYLNWLEWKAPLSTQGLLHIDSAIPLAIAPPSDEKPKNTARIKLPSSEDTFSLYSACGKRFEFPATGGEFTFLTNSDEWLLLVQNSKKQRVISVRQRETIEFEIPKGNQPSYLIIAPAFLRDGAERIAKLHQSRGLFTQFVTTEQIQDSHGNGRLSQEAIRRTIKDWYTSRPRDSGNYALLIGDASWEEPEKGRNLIPTTAQLIDGHLCASDNPYACIDDADMVPDLALGRLPVATEEEFEVLLSKMLQFYNSHRAEETPLETLWIVDQNSFYQESVRTMLTSLENNFLSAELIFAVPEETNETRLGRIRAAIRKGYDWVCYHGHGSRHVWRTGTADYSNQSSIFDSDDITDIATEPGATPARVIFSCSCDNAPFDHPKDDSLGERFLLAPGAGSLTFIGASWRIPSSGKPLQAWTEALKASENRTVGDAFFAMKQSINDQRFIATFNLLGDPAIPLRNSRLNEE